MIYVIRTNLKMWGKSLFVEWNWLLTIYIGNRNQLKRYPGCSNVSIARDQQWSKMNRQGYSCHLYIIDTLHYTPYILYYNVWCSRHASLDLLFQWHDV